jgi:5S rRNA maturation endonuclease (ribonuclease M5)
MIDKQAKEYQAFATFLSGFVRDLNDRSEDGWSLLVEGPRDVRALRKLGYVGDLVTVAAVGRRGPSAVGPAKGVMILTDLDREGTVLASKFVRALAHERVQISLTERRRLKKASRGVFLHIENLGRFAATDSNLWVPASQGRPRPGSVYREGLRKFRRRSSGG